MPISFESVFKQSSIIFKYLFSKIFKGNIDPGKTIHLLMEI